MKIIKSLSKYLIVIFITAVLTLNLVRFSNFSETDYISRIIEKYYVNDIEYDKLEEAATIGMMESLGDKHSYLITSETGFDAFQSNVTGEYAGIGVTITESDGKVKVLKASENSPAYKAGIRVGDYIIKVEGESVLNKTTTEVSSVVKGKPGTDVKITVLRNDEEKDYVVTREKISADSVESKVLNGNTGYLSVSQFDADTDKEVEKHLSNLKNIDGLIIDLRQNPGGIMQVALSFLDMFLEKDDVIVTAKYKESESVYKSENDAKYHMPLVVLVDENSASASEIFAAAIKENKRGTVIGTKTYGKGSIQRTFPLSENKGISLTIGKFYSPLGNTINEVGVTPDILSDISEELKREPVANLKDSEDKPLIDAINYLNKTK